MHVVVAGEIGGAERLLVDLASRPEETGADHQIALFTPNRALASFFVRAGLRVHDRGPVREDPVSYLFRALGPGDYFGEMALIDHSYRSAKITAETELHCLMLTAWDFRPFAMDHPQTAWALLEMMVQRVRDAENR